MQLAYGMYPDGFLPRMVIVSDGNQTQGDVAVEAYRAKELGVQVSWRTFDQDKTSEIRVVGVTVPDEIKVGQPYEVTAEVWSTEAQKATLALQQDEFPNGLEPVKDVELREGKNLIKFKSDAKHAGATTYHLRLAQVRARHREPEQPGGDHRAGQGPAQRALRRGRHPARARPRPATCSARSSTRTSTSPCAPPSGIPSTAKELEKFDLVLVSDVPAHLMGAGQMQALDTYVGQMGGGLIMAGGEDSFGSGGYERTRIEQIMPVRFDSEKIKEQPDVALVLVIDRSGSMQGPKLEAAKESARATAEVLSPNDYIAVVAFDSEAQVLRPPDSAPPTRCGSPTTSRACSPAAAPTSSPASRRRSRSSRASTPRSSTSS